MHKKQKYPIFIMNTGRCGSTLVSQLIGQHPDILSLSEVWPNRVNLNELFCNKVMTGKQFWNLLSVPMAQDIFKIALYKKTQVQKRALHETNYLRRIALPSLVEDYDTLFYAIEKYMINLSAYKTGELIIKMFEYIKIKLNKKVWVEKTGANLDFLPQWKKMWPDMKLIHIYRDGRNSAISMSKHPAFKLQLIRTAKDRTTTFFNIRPLASISLNEFENEYIPLERYGELWNSMILKGLIELENLPKDKLLEFSYESLLEEPSVQLTRLIDFIDSDLETEDWIKEQVGILHSGRSNWQLLDKTKKNKLTSSCSEGLIKLGYEL